MFQVILELEARASVAVQAQVALSLIPIDSASALSKPTAQCPVQNCSGHVEAAADGIHASLSTAIKFISERLMQAYLTHKPTEIYSRLSLTVRAH